MSVLQETKAEVLRDPPYVRRDTVLMLIYYYEELLQKVLDAEDYDDIIVVKGIIRDALRKEEPNRITLDQFIDARRSRNEEQI